MSGKVLARGRIGVDAARAMDKLRDHLLADPSTWLVELLRAAALSNATRFDITYDADDLYVRFDGDAWGTGVIERAAASLGASGGAGDRRGYLLAIATFAALGSGAKRVTVFSRADDGSVESSRFESGGVGEKARGAAVVPKDKRPVGALCVHVEHSLAGIRLGRLVRASRPVEVEVLAARLDEGAPAVTVNGAPLAPGVEPPLLSLPSAEEDGLTLEVTRSWSTPPRMLFVELGVVLSSATWKAETPLGRTHGAVGLPLRAVVRRERLVTNVSRSRVEEELERRVSMVIERSVPSLIEELKRRAASAEDEAARRQFEDALGAMGVVAATAFDAGHTGDPAVRAFEPVLGLPLLWDAVGRKRSLGGARRIAAAGEPVYLREAPQALPADHLPLTRDVFWLRGGPAEAYLRSVAWKPYRAIEKEVERGIALRARRMALAPQPLEVQASPDHVIVHQEESTRLKAVVALRAPGRMGSGCAIRVYVDGRLCETLALAEPPSGIPFDAAITWPEVVHPKRAYDGVLRDRGLERAIHRLGRVAREGLVTHFQGVPVHRSVEVRALVAGGAATADGGALRSLAVWPVIGRPPLTTLEVAQVCEQDGGLRAITPEQHDPAKAIHLPGPVLILDDGDRRALRTLPGGDTRIVPYAAHLARPRSTYEELEGALAGALGVREAPWVRFEQEGRIFVGAPADKDVVVMMHRGAIVSTVGLPPAAGLSIACDDERLLPGAQAPSSESFSLESHTPRIVDGILTSDGVDVWSQKSPAVRTLLRNGAKSVTPGSRGHDALRKLSLFSLVDDGKFAGFCSAERIVALFSKEVPRVERIPEPRVEGLRCILAGEAEATMMTHLSGRPAGLAGETVVRLRRRMARNAARQALLSKAERDPSVPPLGAHQKIAPVMTRLRPGARGVVVAVLADEVASRTPQVTLLFHGRVAGTFTPAIENLPIALLIDVESMRFVPGAEGPKRRWLAGLELACTCAAYELALEMIRRGDPSLFSHQGSLDVLVHAAAGKGRAAIVKALERTTAVAPTIQGQLAPFSLLTQHGVVSYGREAKPVWPRAQSPSYLDEPILLAPSDRRGDALRALCSYMSRISRDVTEAVEELLEARAQGVDPVPESAEPPVHPRLRIRLGGRSVPGLGGQVDIVDGPSALTVIQPGSLAWSPPPQALATLPCSIRGTVRAPKGRFSDAIVGDLSVALGRHLRDLAPDVGDLPPFVTREIRRHIVDELGRKHRISKSVRAAKVFPTKDGAPASLEDIERTPERAELPLIELLPLFRALGKHMTAPEPMTAGDRARSLVMATVARIGEGDLGIARSAEGLSVSHLGIAVANVPRLLGFPALGRVHVPTLTRAELETGALDPLRLAAFVTAAEEALVAAIDRLTAPPSHFLARRFVDRGGRRARLVGWVWIPDGLVESPSVITPSGEARVAIEGRGLRLPLPLTGRLFIADSPEDPAMWSDLADAAWELLASLTSELSPPRAVELEAYLALLRAPHEGEPALLPSIRRVFDRGEPIGVRPGSAEVQSMHDGPSLGADHPLARALARWVPSCVRVDAAPVVTEAPAQPPEPAVVGEASTETLVASPPIVATEPDIGAPEPRLIDRLLTLFGVHPTWNAPKTHPIVRKLERVLARLPLPDGTVIAFSRGGRPVRFAGGRVVIDPEHPTVVALVAQGEVASLAAAILGEANRAISELSDAEERRALVALLLET